MNHERLTSGSYVVTAQAQMHQAAAADAARYELSSGTYYRRILKALVKSSPFVAHRPSIAIDFTTQLSCLIGKLTVLCITLEVLATILEFFLHGRRALLLGPYAAPYLNGEKCVAYGTLLKAVVAENSKT